MHTILHERRLAFAVATQDALDSQVFALQTLDSGFELKRQDGVLVSKWTSVIQVIGSQARILIIGGKVSAQHIRPHSCMHGRLHLSTDCACHACMQYCYTLIARHRSLYSAGRTRPVISNKLLRTPKNMAWLHPCGCLAAAILLRVS